MSKARKNRSETADGRGGSYSRLPHCLIKSPAYRTASFRARAALVVIAGRHNGFNNGRITMSADELAEGLHCQNHRANAAAIGELIARGMAEMVKDHPRGSRLAREYRLTFVSTLRNGQIVPATNEYLAWRVGDAGTVQKRKIGKSRVAMTATERGLSSAITATETERTPPSRASKIVVSERGSPERVVPSSAIITTHIVGQDTVGRDGYGASRDRPEPDRPDCITADAWRAAAAAAADNPAAPSEQELRDRLIVFLAGSPRGTQTALASETGIPNATLSRFINQEGPLPPQTRVLLACELGRRSRPRQQQGRAA